MSYHVDSVKRYLSRWDEAPTIKDLGEKKEPSSKTIHHVYHNDPLFIPMPYYIGGGYHHYHHYHEGVAYADNTGAKATSVIAGIGILLTAAYFLGRSIKKEARVFSKYFETKKINRLAWSLSQNPKYNSLAASLINLTTLQKSIDKQNLQKACIYTAISIAFLVGGALLVAGGLASATPLMIAGLVTAVAAGCVGLFSMSYYTEDKEDRRLKQDCKEYALLAKDSLSQFKELEIPSILQNQQRIQEAI
jgi:hypothetical protein